MNVFDCLFGHYLSSDIGFSNFVSLIIFGFMSIPSDMPQIAALIGKVEEAFGIHPATHSEYVELVSAIESALKEHVSESTLERLWGYSTRKNEKGTVSVRTLNVLSRYAGYAGWDDFCLWLKRENRKESELFEGETVLASSLKAGDRLRLGWQPDRICIVRYLGENLFEVESAENTSLSSGDRFKAIQFQKGRPLYMEEFSSSESGVSSGSYAVGQEHGLTALEKIL